MAVLIWFSTAIFVLGQLFLTGCFDRFIKFWRVEHSQISTSDSC